METEEKRFFDKRSVTRIIVYFLGIFALKGASLILTPLYTHVFTTTQYGTIELANSITVFFFKSNQPRIMPIYWNRVLSLQGLGENRCS